ncbi:hypothetical protein B7494_g519 [Chlorociboria aeruginascens]|nr:hypothetical protein B7494_g519 [Chlorociboria aeruginascens]
MSSPPTTPKSLISPSPRKCPRCPHRLSDFANHIDSAEEGDSISTIPTAEVPVSTATLEPAPSPSYTRAEPTPQSDETNKSHEKRKEISGARQRPDNVEFQSLLEEVGMERLSIHENLSGGVDEEKEGSGELEASEKGRDVKETREDEDGVNSKDVENGVDPGGGGEVGEDAETLERRGEGAVTTVGK